MRNKNLLKKYLERRQISVTDLANQIDFTRQYLSEVANGREPGKRLAKALEKWSKGDLKAADLMNL